MKLYPHIIELFITPKYQGLLLAYYKELAAVLDDNENMDNKTFNTLIKLLSKVLNVSLRKNHFFLQREKAHLDILLISHPDPRIISLPWYFVHRENPRVYFCKSYFSPKKIFLQTTIENKFSVLFVVSSPYNTHQQLSSEKEYKYIYNSLLKLVNSGVATIDVLESGSLNDFEAAIQNGGYDIIHFIGHSRIANEAEFESESDGNLRSKFVGYGWLKDVLKKSRRKPTLFFLSSCDTASGNYDNEIVSPTQHIIESGVPNVISYAYKVSDQLAVEFSSLFYSKLAESLDIAFAFNEAVRILSHSDHPLIASNPQLYCNSAYINLPSFSKKDGHTNVGSAAEHSELVGRLKELQLLTTLIFQSANVNITGREGLGKRTLVREAVRRISKTHQNIRPITVYGLPDNLSLTNLLMQLGDLYHDNFFDHEALTVGDMVQKLKEKFIIVIIYFPSNIPSVYADKPMTDCFDFAKLMKLPVVIISERPYDEGHFTPEVIELRKPDLVDFYRRCMQYDIFKTLHKKYTDIENLAYSLQIEDNQITGAQVRGIISILHDVLEGNYGLLEKFISRMNSKFKGRELSTIDLYKELHSADFREEVKESHVNNDLDVSKLLSLSDNEKIILEIITRFDEPIADFAFHFFINFDPAPILDQLQKKAVIDSHYDERCGLPFYIMFWQYRKKYQYLIKENAFIEENLFADAKLKYFDHLNTIFENYTVAEKVFALHLENGDVKKAYHYGLPIINNLIDQSDNESALDISLRLLTLVESSPDPSYLLGLYNLLGGIYKELNDFESSLSYYNKALATANQVGEKLSEGVALDNIAVLYLQFNDTENALRYSKASAAHLQQLASEKHLAICKMNLGTVYFRMGLFENAHTELNTAITFFEQNWDIPYLESAYNNLALVYAAKGDYKAGLQYLEKSILYLIDSGRYKKAVGTYINMAHAFTERADYAQSEICLAKALTLAERINDKQSYGMVLQERGYLKMLENDYRRALDDLQRSCTFFDQVEDEERKFLSLEYIGDVYKNTDDLDKATKLYQDAIRFYEKSNNVLKLISGLNRLALTYSDKGDYENAWTEIEKAYQLHQEKNISGNLDNTLNNKALILIGAGRYEEALSILSAFEEDINVVSKSQISKTYQNIGSIFFYQKSDYDTAIGFFTKSLQLKNDTNDRKGIANSLNSIASCYYELKNYYAARSKFSEALELFTELENENGMLACQLSLARCLLKIDAFTDAQIYAEQTLRTSHTLGTTSAILSSLQLLADVAIAKGDKKRSLQYQIEVSKMVCLPPNISLSLNVGQYQVNLLTSLSLTEEAQVMMDYLSILKKTADVLKKEY